MDARIHRVLELMEANLAQRATTSKLAGQLGLSRSRFEHLFKKETGTTFKLRLRQVRLDRARRLLADATLRVKEIAAQCGYPCTSNLTRDFKASFGISPSRYRVAHLVNKQHTSLTQKP